MASFDDRSIRWKEISKIHARGSKRKFHRIEDVVSLSLPICTYLGIWSDHRNICILIALPSEAEKLDTPARTAYPGSKVTGESHIYHLSFRKNSYTCTPLLCVRYRNIASYRDVRSRATNNCNPDTLIRRKINPDTRSTLVTSISRYRLIWHSAWAQTWRKIVSAS